MLHNHLRKPDEMLLGLRHPSRQEIKVHHLFHVVHHPSCNKFSVYSCSIVIKTFSVIFLNLTDVESQQKLLVTLSVSFFYLIRSTLLTKTSRSGSIGRLRCGAESTPVGFPTDICYIGYTRERFSCNRSIIPLFGTSRSIVTQTVKIVFSSSTRNIG